MRLPAAAALLVIAPLAAPLAAERLPVQRHGVAEGLAEETVTALLKDSRGYLWIGSLNGLSRYDGERFRVYGVEDGLPKARIWGLAEGVDGSVWVATSGGLARISASQPSTSPVFRPAGPEAGKPVEYVFADPRGSIWWGTGGELYEGGRDGSAPHAAGLAAATQGAVVRVLRLAPDGSILAGTSRGLFRIRSGVAPQRFPLSKNPAAEDVRGLLIDRAGRLWASTPGRLVVAAAGWERESPGAQGPLLERGRLHLPVSPGERRTLDGLPAAGASAWQRILELRDGRVVLTTTAGLAVAGGGRVEFYDRRHGFGDGILGEVLEDAEGDLWIGTQSTGLLRVRPAGFTSFSEEDGLLDAQVAAVFRAADGFLYVASRGNTALARQEGEGFRSVRWRRAAAPVLGRLVWGRSVLRDRSGAWWFASPGGVSRTPPLDFGEELAHAASKTFGPREGVTGEVSALFEASDGAIWAGVYDAPSALLKFDFAAQRFVAVRPEGGLPAGAPLAFVEDGAGDLWVGLGAGGAVRLKGGRAERLDPAHGAPEGFVHDFLLDGTGRLWVANGPAGLLRVDDPAAPVLAARSVDVQSGAIAASALCLAADAAGLIWIGTTRGVVRLDASTGRQAHFTTADGLTNNLVTSAARDAAGVLWFGTPEGVARLAPAPGAALAPARAVIAAFRVNGVDRPVPELGTTSLEGITLAPDENRVRIDFASPSFAPGGRVLFQTRLDGLDPQWSAATPDPTVRYLGLAAGSYRLSVRAVAPDGSPGPEATASFRVRPPFWRHWEFLLSVLALVAAAAFLVHRQGVKQAVAVERVRTRLATDLHDDVGSSLARISILSEVGRRDLDPGGETARLFGEIGETSRGVIDALGDAIWSIDPRHDDLQSLADRLRHFAADLLEGRGITCRIEIPAGAAAVDLPAEPRRHLFLLLKEAVTNAARHSGAHAVTIAFGLGDRALSVEVVDDGAGFDPAAGRDLSEPEGRGLENMAARARALGGSLSVVSAPGGGTRLKVAGLPLPFGSGGATA
ncbi:MAG TPA: two-component regulator propeller domain-containing protein [Thermoanaerobaculia bacterium]|nr:two-component regulator propeller domain-containing protein [Thermoanaerobaculia bacterium]